MVKKATQTLYTQHGIAVLFIAVTCVCLLVSIICMITNPLTKIRYQDVLEALKETDPKIIVSVTKVENFIGRFYNKPLD